MGRTGALLFAGALVLVSCSSDDKASTSTQPTSTASAASAPMTAAASTAAVVPEVVCIEYLGHTAPNASGGDYVYFEYTNAGTTPVAIPAGADNELQNAQPDDLDLRPTVFAGGNVSPAFWATVADGQQLPAWVLTGPDGTARTATPDASTPECTDELLQPTTPDPRTPDLTFAYHLPADAPVPPPELALVAQVGGVPETSVCPAGLEPRPAIVATDDGNGGSFSLGPSVTETLPFSASTDPVLAGAGTTVAGLVVDVCSGAGAETRSWPAGDGFERIRNGVSACFEAVDGRIVMELRDPPFTCSRIAATGGARIRSLPR